MAGGDELRAKLVRAVNEPAELQILIAHHARIGVRPALYSSAKYWMTCFWNSAASSMR